MLRNLIITLFMILSPYVMADDSGVRHIVLCWLHEPDNAEQKAQVMAASRELAIIPGVLDVIVGTPVASEREIVDDSYDVGLDIGFATINDMENYLSHEEHVRRVREIFAPACKRILVYDIAYQDHSVPYQH